MIKRILNVAHFNFDFFENRKLPSFFINISNTLNKNSIASSDFIKIPISEKNKLYRVYNIPPYFSLLLDYKKYRKIELPEIDKGLLVNLDTFSKMEDYINQQFSSRKRKQIRSAIRRLETCFNVSYEFFYGEIGKAKYDSLLVYAKEFITRRFNQINKKHYQLSHWDLIKDNTFKLVREKKASIFVIYDNDRPINICINYHFDKTTCNVFASYDIDYAKFSLGSIDLYKQLEWNINNDFIIFDMAIGELNYKLKWCNNHYDLNHNIIIIKKSLISNLLGALTYIYLRLKFYLYRFHYKNPNNKLTSFLNKSLKEREIGIVNENDFKDYVIKLNPIENFNFDENNVSKIDIESDDYTFLRKPVYDFLHSSISSKNQVSVYKTDIKERYIIKGEKSNQEIHCSRSAQV